MDKRKVICVAVIVLCSAALSFACVRLALGYKRHPAESSSGDTGSQSGIFTYQDQKYVYDKNRYNVLFMGIDKKGEQELQFTPGTAGQADCILLLSMDKKTKDVRLLQISRDTMTDVQLFDVKGNKYTTTKAQLATQYAYAKGEKSSCLAMTKKVEEILHGIPIDAYISLNLDGISAAVDAIGGLDLMLTEDYTDVDPAYTKGTKVSLTGPAAEHFVRYRDTSAFASNEKRMRRQILFVTQLFERFKERKDEDEHFTRTFYNKLNPYLVTDLTADQMSELADGKFLTDQTSYLPGEVRAGAEHEEYYIHEDELAPMLINLFCKKAD